MAGRKPHLQVSVISQSGVIYYGTCDVLFVPTEKDVVAIMAFHTPTIMKLGKGKVVIRDGGKNRELAEIASGLLYVGENQASVLLN